MRVMLALLCVLMLGLGAAAQEQPPKPSSTLAATLASAPYLSLFAQALNASQVALPATGTIFAPTDTAFKQALRAMGLSSARLLKDKALLSRLVEYHILPTALPSSAIKDRTFVKTQSGRPLRLLGFKGEDGKMRYKIKAAESDANVLFADIKAGQQVLYVIRDLLLPTLPTPSAKTAAKPGATPTTKPAPTAPASKNGTLVTSSAPAAKPTIAPAAKPTIAPAATKPAATATTAAAKPAVTPVPAGTKPASPAPTTGH